jgi:hypothetical protein
MSVLLFVCLEAGFTTTLPPHHARVLFSRGFRVLGLLMELPPIVKNPKLTTPQQQSIF